MFIIVVVLINLTCIGVICPIDILPKPLAIVNVGEDLTINCTRASNTWSSFTYHINEKTCFLTFKKEQPHSCKAEFSSCLALQNYNYSYYCDAVHFNLILQNVPRSLHGVNISGVLSGDGIGTISSGNVTIQVNVPLKGVTLHPSGVLVIREEITQNFTCSADSVPSANLSWALNGSSIFETALLVNNGDTVTETYPYNATKQDNGKTLTCTASYGSVIYTGNATLNITYRPSVQIIPSAYIPYRVIENTTDVQLTCSVVDANPIIVESYKWYKNGTILQDAKAVVYTILTVKSSNSGHYSCDASNKVGTSQKSRSVIIDVLVGITLDELKRTNVTSGSKLDITCTGYSNPLFTDDNVRWTKLKNSTFTQTGRQLIINNVDKVDRGVYTCTVIILLSPSIGESVNVSANTSFQLDVLYKPTVALYPSKYNPYKVIENVTNIQLSCSVDDANPEVVSYRWYKNGFQIPNISTVNYTIPIIRQIDSGNYTCDANNSVGISESQAVTLDVLFGVTLNRFPTTDIKVGSNFSMTCIGKSNPPITDDNVRWTKQNNNTFQKTGRRLIINNVDIADKGVYICSVNITFKPSEGQPKQAVATSLLSLDVLYVPTVNIIPSQTNLTVTENVTEITLKCNLIDSNPKAHNFTWIKNGSPFFFDSDVFEIIRVDRDDNGTYTCTATNIVGESKQSPMIFLNVQYAVNHLNVSTSEIIVNETEPWIVTCKADGNPPPSFKWVYSYNGSILQPHSVSPSESSISIRNANCKDSGIYIVTSQNGIGSEAFLSFDVKIQCKPREIMNRQQINIFINESDYYLAAIFIAYPQPNISWSLTDNTTNVGDRYNISTFETDLPFKYGSFLSKYNNEQLDRGKYYAIAVNEHGSSKITFNIEKRDSTFIGVQDTSVALLSGISGAAGSAILIVAVLAFYFIRRRKSSGQNDKILGRTDEHDDKEDNDYGLNDNPLYGDGKAVYGVVSKNKTKSNREQVKESNESKNYRDMVYENSTDFLELFESNDYANSSETASVNNTINREKQNRSHKNKDGLIYADLLFEPSMKQFVIHGVENKTNYASIDLAKTAEPLPFSDEDDDQ